VRYVELSAKMLDLASQRIQDRLPERHATVDFVQGRAEDEIWVGKYDLVLTHCLLDMFPQQALEAVVGQLQGVLKPDGRWYFSDFQIVRAWPMRWISHVLVWTMYRFFRLTCGIAATHLPDFEHAFQMQGLTEEAARLFWGGMIVARLYRKGAQV
jgi:SAM-dependent methyltransferase